MVDVDMVSLNGDFVVVFGKWRFGRVNCKEEMKGTRLILYRRDVQLDVTTTSCQNILILDSCSCRFIIVIESLCDANRLPMNRKNGTII